MLAIPYLRVLFFVLLLSAFCVSQDPDSKELQFFENKIRPLFVKHCYECHNKDKHESDLRLDTSAGILTGGVSGPAVVAGKPDESLIVIALDYHDDNLQMPPDGKLRDDEISAVRRWVKNGAVVPKPNASVGPSRGAIDMDLARKFWSFQPPKKSGLPRVVDVRWPKTSIDYFILSKLEANQLSPASRAEKRKLIRRATFDLTGLPPMPEDIAAFLNDDSEWAFAKVVDRLLGSRAYGERWGRHWLDVARYADSNGLDENVAHGNAWRYRDYVVDALSQDKPFDQFVVEQLAGDLLSHHSDEDRIDHLVATGFLSLGPKVLAEGDEAKMEADIIDEQIDTIGRAFMGLTLGCARCHDHKFDPIRTEDYYALAGVFKSTKTMESFKRIAKWNENEIATIEELNRSEQIKNKMTKQETAVSKLIVKANEELIAKLADESKLIKGSVKLPKDSERQYPDVTKKQLALLRGKLQELKASLPKLPTAMGVVDAIPVDARIHIRGSHLSLGKQVQRGVPLVVAADGQPEFDDSTSGRLQLARWLVGNEHPLTSRVIVNRVWRWYFGRGLVDTPDNFGKLGARPVNQPLLDHLAIRLVESNWSLKALHREILLSNTYQMSSNSNELAIAIDPENRLQWRASIRRLEAEEIRDSILAVSGLVDRSEGGSMLNVGNREFIFDHTSKDKTSYETTRRSIYLPVVRNHLCDVLSLFDYSDASVSIGNRATSTIAPQALFLMNSDFLEHSSQALAERLSEDCTGRDKAGIAEVETKKRGRSKQKVVRLYQLLFGRNPQESEIGLALRFVEKMDQVECDESSKAQGLAAQGSKEENLGKQGSDKQTTSNHGWQALCHVMLMSSEFLHVK